ncbi:MAG TPA: response regulator [Caulobacteraceae bacterium]|nr:response regulator [Caulobacteraceae bacterium]
MLVEDEGLIALAIEDALIEAGFDVCAITTSEVAAIETGTSMRPEFAVVDVKLAPGDGRKVAQALSTLCGAIVVIASSESPATLHGLGAWLAVTKPFDPCAIPVALMLAQARARGDEADPMPPQVSALRPGSGG